MKLSMWMIANRLSSFDLELSIDEKAPAVLNSARLAYATNCVHVYPEKDYVVCNGEGNIIKIHNMTITQAFEIVQGVFDYFEDWAHQISLAIKDRDYQEVINLSWQVFRNPLVLFDGNNKILGITRQYASDALDSEWAYLSKYGYSSLNSIQMMKRKYNSVTFHRHGFQTYKFADDTMIKYPGVFYGLYWNDICCGHLNLLCADRPLNEGDYQMLEQLAKLLEPSLGQSYYKQILNHNNVFYNILFGKPYDDKKLAMQLAYQQWKEDDTYHLVLIQMTETSGKQEKKRNLDILVQTISQQFPQYVVLKKNPYVLLLTNNDLSGDPSAMQFFRDLAANNPILIGFSIPCHGLKQANKLHQQAKAAIYYGSLEKPEEKFYHFFDYALDFMIDSPSLHDCVSACMPGVTELWKMHQNTGDEMLTTLKCFLDNERSASRTSAALYTHRNTILYRIQKIQDILQCNLDDVYVRDYCKMSLRTLELYHRKNKLPPELSGQTPFSDPSDHRI